MAAAALTGALALAGCSHSAAHHAHSDSTTRSAPSSPSPSTNSTAATLQPQNVFSAASVWRRDISRAPLAGNSAAMTQNLVAQVRRYYGGIAAFNVNRYNPTWYNASSTQATTTVKFTNCQGKPNTPAGLFGHGGQFVAVPIPADATTSTGTDSTLTVYRRSTDQLWSFWKASREQDGWHACWGGRIDHVANNPGYFLGGFGPSASGLASDAGDVSITDARLGRIDHAVTLTIPAPASWKDVSWPAQRSDGDSSDPAAIPEGTRLRLDPSVDVNALHLNPISAMIARAAQKYGFIVTDKSGSVSVVAESGAPTARATGINPWQRILGGLKSYEVMKDFPWQHVQVLPRNYGK